MHNHIAILGKQMTKSIVESVGKKERLEKKEEQEGMSIRFIILQFYK